MPDKYIEEARELLEPFCHFADGIEWCTNPSPDELREAIASALRSRDEQHRREVEAVKEAGRIEERRRIEDGLKVYILQNLDERGPQGGCTPYVRGVGQGLNIAHNVVIKPEADMMRLGSSLGRKEEKVV